MAEVCDILIVGCGPAGATAAKVAADLDTKVIVIDRKNQITSPLRGGEAVCKPYYEALLKEMPFLKRIKEWEMNGTIIWTKYCEFLDKEDIWKASLLDRKELEKVMAVAAIDAGAKLYMATNFENFTKRNGIVKALVQSHGGNRIIKAKILIGADGFASIVRNKLGLSRYNKDWATAVEYEMAGINFKHQKLLQVYFGDVPGGYAYIFQKEGSLGLSGVAMRPAFWGNKISPAAVFSKLKKEHPDMAPQLKEAHTLHLRGGCIDVSGPASFAKGPIALVGDAANQNFPYIGEGLLPSIVGASVCAKLAAEAISQNNLKILANYPTEYSKTQIAKEVAITLKIKNNIDEIIQRPDLSEEVKIVLMTMLEFEVIDWTGKELSNALKCKSASELLKLANKLIKEKGLKIKAMAH